MEKIVPARRVTLRSKTLQVRKGLNGSSCKSVEGKNFSNNCPAVPNRAVFWLTSSPMVTKLSRAQLDYK